VYRTAKNIYRKVFKIKLYNDQFKLKFLCNTESDLYVYSEIYGEEDAYRINKIQPIIDNGIVLEIGAHKGFFTLLAATFANKVIVFEPDKENFKYLDLNIKLNKTTNVIPVHKAVFASEGKKTFTISKVTGARHTLYQSDFSGDGEKTQVDCTTLNSIFKDYLLERVNLLKLDCEGSEYDIIYNSDKSLFAKIDAIAMEIHEIDSIPYKKDDLVKFIEKLGYNADIYNKRKLESLNVWMGLFTKK
jgi:FkbM family methyltransferase